jgi:hypothetical protein
MDHAATHRPRVSRETRRLLITAFVALTALWVLAGIRFPDRPASPNPVQPLLSQLAPRPRFDDLASEISEIELRVTPLLATVWASSAVPAAPALRIREDVAAVLLGSGAIDAGFGESVIRLDRASGLALTRVPPLPVAPPIPWIPATIERARYLLVSDMAAGAPSLRPVFVSALAETDSPIWPGPVWVLPASSDLAAGSFVFSSDGRLAGLVINHGGQLAVVPGSTLLSEAARLLTSQNRPPGRLGIEVQALTPLLAKATGASQGVVVRSIDSAGPARGRIRAGDVLESVNGNSLLTPLHWDAAVARMAAGDTVTLRVRRPSNALEAADIEVTVVPADAASSKSLGLTLRNVAGVGVAVTSVVPASVAGRAGIRAGDIITRAAAVDAPGEAALRRIFNQAATGDVLVVALTRDGRGLVTALAKE